MMEEVWSCCLKCGLCLAVWTSPENLRNAEAQAQLDLVDQDPHVNKIPRVLSLGCRLESAVRFSDMYNFILVQLTPNVMLVSDGQHSDSTTLQLTARSQVWLPSVLIQSQYNFIASVSYLQLPVQIIPHTQGS